jgi:hypothetical protein
MWGDDMAWVYDKTRIQNRLREIVAAANFPVVEYEGAGNTASLSESETSAPESVEVNQISKEMGIDGRNGRQLVYRPTDWRFDLVLAFRKEVGLDELEQALRATPRVSRDAANNHPLVLLRMRDVDYEEPPRRGGPMKVTYTLDADVERT